MKNIFLTGEIGVGKSTAINKIISFFPELIFGGFRTISSAPITDGAYLDVFIESAWEPTPHDSAHIVGTRWGNNVFTAYPAVFDNVGTSILISPPAKAKLVIMDELGVMESDAELFKSAVLKALNGTLPVLGVIKPKRTDFLDSVRFHENSLVFEVTEQNREELLLSIVELIKREIK